MAQQVDELSIKISSNARQAIRDLNALSSSLQRVGTSFRSTGSRLSGLSIGVGKLTRGMTGFGNANGFASKMSKSLTSSLASLALKVFSLTKAFSFLKTGIESAMNFTETVNYFEVAVRDIGRGSASNWQQAGYRSAEEYVNSFTGRLKNLTTDMTGFRVDEYGNTTEVIGPNLGLDPNQVMQYQAMYTQMSSSMGLTADTAVNMSKALTMLGADWASLRNVDFSESWNKMASALAGQSRAVRAYGIDITNARLQEEAYKYGITDNIQTMSQAEKAQLRLLAILDQSHVAYADLANTMMSYSNQIRYMKQQFSNLARVIGSLFLPVIEKVLPYINGLIIAFRRLFEEMARVLGISFRGINSSMSGMSDDFADMTEDTGLEDMFSNASDSAEDANDSVEKLKRTVLSFDELHLLNDNSKDENSSSSNDDDNKIPRMGGNPLLDSAIAGALGEYESVWQDALARMENRVYEIADKIGAFFDRVRQAWRNGDLFDIGAEISNWVYDKLDNIDWEKIQEKVSGVSQRFATLFAGLLDPKTFAKIGETIANGVNTIVLAIHDFGKRFEEKDGFLRLGLSIKGGLLGALNGIDWGLIYSTAEIYGRGIGTTFNTVFADAETWKAIGRTLAGGVNTVFRFLYNYLDSINWHEVGEGIGKGILEAINYIDWELIRQTFRLLIGSVFDIAIGATDALGLDGLSSELEDLKEKLLDLYDGIDWTAISDALKTVGEAIGIFAAKVVENVSEIVINLINDLAHAINAISDWYKSLPPKIKEGLEGFADGLAKLVAIKLTAGFVLKLAGLGTSLGGLTTGVAGFSGDLGTIALISGLATVLHELTAALHGDEDQKTLALSSAMDTLNTSVNALKGTSELTTEKAQALQRAWTEATEYLGAGGSADDALQTFATRLHDAGISGDELKQAVGGEMDSNMSSLYERLQELDSGSEGAEKSMDELSKKTESYANKALGWMPGFSTIEQAGTGIESSMNSASEAFGGLETAVSESLGSISTECANFDVDLSQAGANAGATFQAGLEANPPKVPKVGVTGYTRHFLTGDQQAWVDTPDFGVLGWFAKGGVFTTPTIAGIGEAGAEAVLPLTNKKTMGMIASSIADSGKAFSGMSADDIQEAVATGVAMAISQNPQIVEVVVNSTLRTSDEKLAQSVSRGRAKLNQRYNPSIVASY